MKEKKTTRHSSIAARAYRRPRRNKTHAFRFWLLDALACIKQVHHLALEVAAVFGLMALIALLMHHDLLALQIIK